MFTGIIETTGEVENLDGSQLTIRTQLTDQLSEGSSIAVDGVCLTATELHEDCFVADVMPETISKTIIKGYEKGRSVNLERPLKADGRFDGHMVLGHVEGVVKVVSIGSADNAHLIKFEVEPELSKYIVPKGSIALNGISLTVVEVSEKQFSVSIIPLTWERTNLQHLAIGDKVNVETDVLAKYAEKFSRLND